VNNGYTIKRSCPKVKVLRESMLLAILVYFIQGVKIHGTSCPNWKKNKNEFW